MTRFSTCTGSTIRYNQATSTSPQFGQRITWSDRDGTINSVGVPCQYETSMDALRAAFEAAVVFGWTRPRWWQWWRWNEPLRKAPQ